ncbi:hypothetical protein G6F46_009075 [Rhizopus delemar]|uniref:Core Histone H2A/H2B/H3 domain-containing protein n=2 Tax=Rhizopus TaxID=4842 RepID=A0A9P6Z210_9FUNG|nr:hypothetical protein G6F55_008327 [Rhizopus delemar]KAG1539295.1 hypothetical protein G6F51_009224 [Rhizopus arrhizus]KAG1491304.1 hypothetical protein G6F54_010115 [Rhizopus delemar]KAG1507580.1 hypothetical protein G6F53_008840 [Rhizopus delemar]KAG1514532.1 hypothetical protein G6F52_009901 [Rhizopus delemar]
MASHPHQEPQHAHHELHAQPMTQTYQTPITNTAAGAAGHPQATTAGQPVFDLSKFWQEEMGNAERFDSDFKNHALPLARIKKVMKTDHEVKMISAEAPILFAKGCEIFITELTKRAWVHAEENKRRTLQRSDIATAISKTDMCDFLIDIVPREEAVKSNAVYDHQTAYASNTAAAAAAATTNYYPQQYAVDTASYYPQLPQFTSDQMQQYQMQLQQFAQQQQHQQQQHLPHPQDPSQPQPPQQSQPQPQPYQTQDQPHSENETKSSE